MHIMPKAAGLAGVALAVTMVAAPASAAPRPPGDPDAPVSYLVANAYGESVIIDSSKAARGGANDDGHAAVDAFNDVQTSGDGPRNRELFEVTDIFSDGLQAGALWWTKKGGVIDQYGICDNTQYGSMSWCLLAPNVAKGETIYYVAAACNAGGEDPFICTTPGQWVDRSAVSTFSGS